MSGRVHASAHAGPAADPTAGPVADPGRGLDELKQLVARGAMPGALRALLTRYREASPDDFTAMLMWMQKTLGNTYTGAVLDAEPTAIASEVAPLPTGDGGTPAPPASAPTGRDDARYAFYAEVVRKAGGTVAPGKVTVLGVRCQEGVTPHFFDYFYVLTADQRVIVFRGSTTPSMKQSSDSPDVAGPDGTRKDGQGDTGMIRPGSFTVKANGIYALTGKPSFHVQTTGGSGRLPGWRDTDHDGDFSEEERAQSEARGDYLTQVLFHAGANSDYRTYNEQAALSIGCMTVAPSEIDAFIAAVGGAGASFAYTLVPLAAVGTALPDVLLQPLAPSRGVDSDYAWTRQL